MTRIKKTYSLDDRIIKRLELGAATAGLNISAYLTVLINAAAPQLDDEQEDQQPQPVALEQ